MINKDWHFSVCIASMAPFVGGAEVAAERLALGLQEEGHEVFMLLGQQNAVMERMQKAGLTCVYAPMYFTDKWHWLRYVRARHAIRQVFQQRRPNIIHSNDFPTHQIISDAARGLGVPRICHHRFPFSGPTINWLNKYGAERHLFVSRALMEEMSGQSRELSHSAHSIVYDGLTLPPRSTLEDRRQAKIALNLPLDRLITTFAGQIIERKGVADLIQAWSLLGANLQQMAELIIVGDDLQDQGRYRAAMEALAYQLGCAARFVGYQDRVDHWLLASDIAVVPSHVEPLGNATLEAMAFALPVIGSAVGGIPEMVLHEQTGLLIPPRSPHQLAAALTVLIANAEIRIKFGKEGRQRCENHFSLRAHAQAVCDEYRQALRPQGLVKTQ